MLRKYTNISEVRYTQSQLCSECPTAMLSLSIADEKLDTFSLDFPDYIAHGQTVTRLLMS